MCPLEALDIRQFPAKDGMGAPSRATDVLLVQFEAAASTFYLLQLCVNPTHRRVLDFSPVAKAWSPAACVAMVTTPIHRTSVVLLRKG